MNHVTAIVDNDTPVEVRITGAKVVAVYNAGCNG